MKAWTATSQESQHTPAHFPFRAHCQHRLSDRDEPGEGLAHTHRAALEGSTGKDAEGRIWVCEIFVAKVSTMQSVNATKKGDEISNRLTLYPRDKEPD